MKWYSKEIKENEDSYPNCMVSLEFHFFHIQEKRVLKYPVFIAYREISTK